MKILFVIILSLFLVGFTFTSWELTERQNYTIIPVPSFRPLGSDSAIALDIYPNGMPSDGQRGVAWLDVCNRDLKHANNDIAVACIGLDAHTDFVNLGMWNYDGYQEIPLIIKNRGGTAQIKISQDAIKLTGQIYINGELIKK